MGDPLNMAKLSYDTSKAGTEKLIRAFTTSDPFNAVEHFSQTLDAKREARKKRNEQEDDLLQRTLARFPEDRKRAIERSVFKTSKCKSSGWLSVLPLQKQHFDLSPCEFRDALAIRYKRKPVEMPSACDGCGCSNFSLEHALSCKTGGLITRRHNEVRDVFGELMTTAWGNCIKEPIITEADGTSPGLRGDLACRGVWEPQRVALFDVRVIDTDAPSYVSRPVSNVLTSAEQEKQRKYLEACEQRHATFTPLVCTADALLAPQMTAFVKLMAERLAERWSRSQSVLKGWLRARIAFSVIRASSMCLRGTRKKWRCSEDLLGFSDGAALGLGQ